MTRHHRERIRERIHDRIQQRRQYVNSILTGSGPSSEPVPEPSTVSSPVSSPSDKSNQAAQMAQELASQSSWADTFAPATPATTATPVASTVDGEERDRLHHEDVFEAPPPSYEESRATHEASSAMPLTPTTSASPNTQPNQDNVRQASLLPSTQVPAGRFHAVEIGETSPLLPRDVEAMVTRKDHRRKQKRFVLIFLIIAIWLMGIQAVKGLATGFWCADGTPIPPLPQRNYTQHETSSPITGTFTFYDALELSTQSGSINISIDPQPSNVTGVIRLSAKSGSVRVKLSDEYMQRMKSTGTLDRTFDIEVKTASGSQNLELPIGNGSAVVLTAASGSITLTAFAASLGPNDTISSILTETVTGSQRVQVKDFSREPVTALAAKHYAKGSAGLKLGYPPSWDGMVHASVGGSGNLDVRGSNLHFQRNGNKEIYAWRLRADESEQKQRQGQVIEARCDGSGSIKVDCSAN